MPQTIGFIGLGSKGLPIASNLTECGFQVLAYNARVNLRYPRV
jgi:3-hydroxyisobutyrate dehydrogenase-like beta-hydroxyacid dehydrogenase